MLHPDPGTQAPLNRRRVLVGGGRGLLALMLLGASVSATACGSGKPPEPDPLEAELAAARRDSELAAAAAKGAPRALTPALLVIADQRARHATALVEELARAAGKPTPTETTTTAAADGQAKPGSKPTVDEVANALRASAASATKLAATQSGYRAGLMGSIAAACTASYTVGLIPLPAKGAR